MVTQNKLTKLRSIPDLLYQQVKKDPTQSAIIDESTCITYDQLWQTIISIAGHLKTFSDGQKPIFIYGEKSIEFIASIYACLLLGYAYIPIQAIQPEERLKYIIKDSEVSFCLYTKKHSKFFTQLSVNGTCIEALLLNEKVENLRLPAVDLEKHAYTLYTSGSTGTPKGVLFSQHNLLSFVNWAQQTFNLTKKDRVAAFAPFHFDLSTFDIFVTLSSGASIYLVPEYIKSFPDTLATWYIKHAITITYLVPTVIISLLKRAALKFQQAKSLRLILFAGEVFPLQDLCQLRSLFKNIFIANLYGPTETNVCAWYAIPDLTKLQQFIQIPFGNALPKLNLFIINEKGLELTAPNSEGELCCLGDNVSLGYLNPPPAEDSFFYADSQRGFKTGDIVKRTPEGFVFLYRKDKQIKRNGYRIEPSEIEACLRQHDSILEAAVISKDNDLIAYLTGKTCPVSELIALCDRFLPKMMHPTQFVFLEKLPKTASEKIDYQTLMQQEQIELIC